jgi:hypothetical protein
MIALLHLLWRSARGKENALLVASTLACAGYTVLVALTGGDWMPQQRFLAPLVPLQALLLMRSLSLSIASKDGFSRGDVTGKQSNTAQLPAGTISSTSKS